MKTINFLDASTNCNNWYDIIMDQHTKQFNNEGYTIPEWYQWLKNEWQCDLVLSDNKEAIVKMVFSDRDYTMAVLKYGLPSGQNI